MATRNQVNSPVEVGSLFHYLQGFSTFQTVIVWDFFHQQYDWMLLDEPNFVGGCFDITHPKTNNNFAPKSP